MKYKREVILLNNGARIDFVPNSEGGLKNSYLRIEDRDGNYVDAIDGKVALKKLSKLSTAMLAKFPVRKKAKAGRK